jgi:hypothetical protein
MSTLTEALTLANETEVTARAQRRRFMAPEKLRVLREAVRCAKPGELGAVLRGEGSFSSHLSTWCAQGVRAKAQSWEVGDERLDWPGPELTHTRLHGTIYDSLDDAFVSEP